MAVCAICRMALAERTCEDGSTFCLDCIAWAEGKLGRRAPGGIPPASRLEFFMRDRVEAPATIRLLPRAVRDRFLAEHVAVVEEFAVDLPAVVLTDHDGNEGLDDQ